MSAKPYDQILASLLYVLANAPTLNDVGHCTDDPNDPTMEQCPAILGDVKRFDRSPARLTALVRSASPFNENIYLSLKVWVFDAEGPATARRQLHDLVRRTMDVVADNPTLNDTVQYGGVHRGDFQVIPAKGGGVFACADLSVECLAQS